MIIGNGISPAKGIISGSATFDSDAQAFIDAASITDSTQQNAINQLVLDLKGFSLWTKFYAIYPCVGGTASTHKWNLKDPRDLDAAYRLTFFGGWTHSTTGMLPNGTNAYADTFLVPNTVMSVGDAHMSIYSRTAGTSGFYDCGAVDNRSSADNMLNIALKRTSGNTSHFDCGDDPSRSSTTGIASAQGDFTGSCRSTSDRELYHDGVSAATNTTLDSDALASFSVYIGALNDAGNDNDHSAKEVAFFSLGTGLTDTEAANFYTAKQTFQTSLSRNV